VVATQASPFGGGVTEGDGEGVPGRFVNRPYHDKFELMSVGATCGRYPSLPLQGKGDRRNDGG